MSDQRLGLVIDTAGICSACRHVEQKELVDWSQRKKMFQKLLNKYRSNSDANDCLVAVSAGKDSFWQVYTLVEKYKMNPLLVSVWNLDWSKTGLENFDTMQNRFGVEALCLHSNKEVNKKISRAVFEHDGFTAHLFDRYIYTYPIWMAIKLDIPLVFYGENTSVEYGGPLTKETPSAINQINNDAVREYDWSLFENAGVKRSDIPYAKFPDAYVLSDMQINPQYMSYYFKWSGYEHMEFVKSFGWKSLDDTKEWCRQGYIEDYDQIDDFAYCVDPWLKFFKYGHARATDVASIWIREGRISRKEGIKLVKEHDYKIDPLALEHYLKFSGYSEEEFWYIYGKFLNKDIFKYDKNFSYDKHKYVLKNPIWKQNI